MQLLFIAGIIAGAWALINGILHDIFVLRSEHAKQYDRTLLRLLMDGHILISSGILQCVAAFGLRQGADWGFFVAGFSALSLLVYCFMIFPFLRSIGTICVNLALLILLIIGYF